MYTGSDGEVFNWYRCLSVFLFALSGLSALSGIIFTTFGSTGYFRTDELNNTLLIVGVVLLVMALGLVVLGFGELAFSVQFI